MILTKRDIHIFHILNEFGFLESDTLSKVITPTSKHKTFTMRLLTLKKHGFIKEIGKNERIRNQNAIYTLNTSKETIRKIYFETGKTIYPTFYNSSYTMFNHQLYLGKLLAYLLTELQKRNIEVDISKILGSKTIQKAITKEQDTIKTIYEYLDYVVIPDAIIQIGDCIYCFELENTNSYQQATDKIKKYQQLLLRKDNKKFFPVFQGKKIILILGCWDYKKEKYKEILKDNFTGKYLLLNIDNF